MNASTDASSLKPGTIVGGDFVIERALASGGMGSVYVVRQRSTQRLRALKVLASELLSDPKTCDSFMREAQVGAQIQSSHVVEVIAAGIDKTLGVPWLVMELLEGYDLRDQMCKGGGLAFDQAMRILREVFHAIGAAHQAGIVHRDLKPENLFLHRRHEVRTEVTAKVLDFGIAKVLSGAATGKLTRNIGTPGWMAPEQCNSSTVTPATDVWSLALVAFFALTGQDFWICVRTMPGNLQALLVEMLVDPIPLASVRAAQLGVSERLPPCLDWWFAKCLNRDPSGRFQNAAEAWNALQAALATQTAAPAMSAARPPSGPLYGATELAVPPAYQSGHAGMATGQPYSTPARAPTPGSNAASAYQSGAVVVEPNGTMRTVFNTPQRPDLQPVLPSSRQGQKFPVVPAIIAGTTLVAGVTLGVLFWAGVFSQATSSAKRLVSAPASAPALPVAASSPTASAPTVAAPAATDASPGVSSVAIPAGTITLGGVATPIAPFAIDVHETTLEEWKACVVKGECRGQTDKVVLGAMPPEQVKYWSGYCNHARQKRGNYPINCVSYAQAAGYCASQGKRLPTAPEWLYAAYQGGSATQRKYPWGDSFPTGRTLNVCGLECAGEVGLPAKAEEPFLPGFDDGERESAPVGSFSDGDTPLGLHDMAGNVWEWTSSPGDSSGDYLVLGAGWFDRDPAKITISQTHKSVTGETQHSAIGFRCVR